MIRLGSLITLYNGIYTIGYAIFILIFSNVILSEYFRKVPVSWEVFKSSFPERASLYVSLLLAHAFFLLSLGIFIIYISYLLLKKRDKMAWVILFFAGIIGWASLFIMNVLRGSWIIIILSFIGWVSFALGMIIPIGYYLRKELPEL